MLAGVSHHSALLPFTAPCGSTFRILCCLCFRAALCWFCLSFCGCTGKPSTVSPTHFFHAAFSFRHCSSSASANILLLPQNERQATSFHYSNIFWFDYYCSSWIKADLNAIHRISVHIPHIQILIIWFFSFKNIFWKLLSAVRIMEFMLLLETVFQCYVLSKKRLLLRNLAKSFHSKLIPLLWIFSFKVQFIQHHAYDIKNPPLSSILVHTKSNTQILLHPIMWYCRALSNLWLV